MVPPNQTGGFDLASFEQKRYQLKDDVFWQEKKGSRQGGENLSTDLCHQSFDLNIFTVGCLSAGACLIRILRDNCGNVWTYDVERSMICL